MIADNFRKLLWPAVILVVIVAVDQVTKLWAVHSLAGKPSVRILGDFFMFTLVYNEGGALGTRIGPASYYLIASILIFIFVLYYTWANRDRKVISIPLSMIAGGAVGNIIDRLRLGKVIDFIDVDFFDISIGSFHLTRWWTFNIADAAISCSIVFLLFVMLIRPEPRQGTQDDPDNVAEEAREYIPGNPGPNSASDS